MKTRIGQSPLLMSSYFVPELTYKVVPGSDVTPSAWLLLDIGDIEVTIGYREPQEEESWRFELTVEPAKALSDFPYDFTVKIVGEFAVDPDFPAAQKIAMIHVNAPSMLFSIARELLAAATSRSPYPPVMLPTIRFIPDEDEGKKSSPPKASKKPAQASKTKVDRVRKHSEK